MNSGLASPPSGAKVTISPVWGSMYPIKPPPVAANHTFPSGPVARKKGNEPGPISNTSNSPESGSYRMTASLVAAATHTSFWALMNISRFSTSAGSSRGTSMVVTRAAFHVPYAL